MELRRKRAYDTPSADDGFRVLVDRLWPRGGSKERAAIDAWAKDVAPTPDLRREWHSAPDEGMGRLRRPVPGTARARVDGEASRQEPAESHRMDTCRSPPRPSPFPIRSACWPAAPISSASGTTITAD
ncbi:MAG: DUF488 family protein [Microbacterium sp.]|uniref:DUF488 domain-containing protein n=1 Tax=Microbacterium sp. TaxID=51671 RepID=UPI003BAE3D42